MKKTILLLTIKMKTMLNKKMILGLSISLFFSSMVFCGINENACFSHQTDTADNSLKEEYVISPFEPTFFPPSINSNREEYSHYWTFYDAADCPTAYTLPNYMESYIMSGDGSTIVIRLALNYNRTLLFSIQGNQPLWETPHDQPYYISGISYDGSVIILYDDNNFHRVTKDSCQPVWTYPREGGIGGGKITSDGSFVFFTQGSNIFKMDIETLDTLWTASVDEGSVGKIWCAGNDSIFSANSVAVYLFDTSGTRLWRRPFSWNPPYYMGRTISKDGSIIVTKKDGTYPPTPSTKDAWIKVYKWSEGAGEYQFSFESIFDYGEFMTKLCAISISPENSKLVVASNDRTDNAGGGNDFYSATVRMFDLVNNSLIWERRWLPDGVSQGFGITAGTASFSLDGSKVTMGFFGDNGNIMDDFLIFESDNSEEIFALNSPGSPYLVCMSEDGMNAVAAAKAVPMSVAGSGTYLYAAISTNGLGNITGIVDLEHAENDSGAIVILEGTDKYDTTDTSGYYFIENVLEGNYNLTANKDPWYVPETTQLAVTGGDTATADFILQSALPAPENLIADSYEEYIALTWTPSGTPWPKEWTFYDDGSFESGIASNSGGTNLTAMRFTPSAYPAMLDSVKFYVYDYGNPTLPVDIYIMDDDGIGGSPGTPIAGPFNVTPNGPGWTYLDIPDNVMIDSGDFYVSAFYLESGGPYIGLDTDLEYYYDRNWWGYDGPPPCSWDHLGDIGTGTYDYDLGYRALVEIHSLEYKIYRGTQSGGPYDLIATIIAPDTTYIDYNVTTGNIYYYVVSAYYHPATVESDFSNEDNGSPTVGINNNIFRNIIIYPNPVKNIFKLSFNSNKSENLSVKVISIDGKIMYSENIKNFTGNYNNNIDVNNFSKGIYIINISNDKSNINKKLIVQ